ncbi:MAG: hypothetical protein IJ538_01970 [Clostridia bacterium]|nr:hypothetical protein [Clostridia bacterium]
MEKTNVEKLKTYSLFILKPGFLFHKEGLDDVLTQNGIVIIDQVAGAIDRKEIEVHYEEHKGKSFYDGLVNYMAEGEVIGLPLFDNKVITMLISSSNADELEPDFILRTRKLVKEVLRPMFELQNDDPRFESLKLNAEEIKEIKMTANGIHASDGPESAYREVIHFFPNYAELLEKPQN